MFRFKRVAGAASLAVALASAQAGEVHVGVDTTQTWLSFATIWELPSAPGADRGAYVFSYYYNPGTLPLPPGRIVGEQAVLTPNATFAPAETDTGNPFFNDWWQPDGAGGLKPNKIMADGFYVENDSLAGNTVHFTGRTTWNSLAAPYVARAYVVQTIGPAYSFVSIAYSSPLVAGEVFSVSLPALTGDHVAYGIELVGPNAHAAELASLGSVAVAAVPEPAGAALLAAGMLALALRRARA